MRWKLFNDNGKPLLWISTSPTPSCRWNVFKKYQLEAVSELRLWLDHLPLIFLSSSLFRKVDVDECLLTADLDFAIQMTYDPQPEVDLPQAIQFKPGTNIQPPYFSGSCEKDSAHQPRCTRDSSSGLYGWRTWSRRTVVTWRLASGGVGVSLLTGGLGVKDATCFSMIVSFMARGMVWELREKVGNSYCIRKGPYECQMH